MAFSRCGGAAKISRCGSGVQFGREEGMDPPTHTLTGVIIAR